jgi:citrate synthase
LGRFREEARVQGAAEAVAARLAEDRGFPGFGHPLYPQGDPRAVALLARFKPPADMVRLAEQVSGAAALAPNIDFALVALCEHLRAPEGAALSLFAAARCAGWIAHALEQVQDGGLIRPRARYTGPILDQDPAE